MKIVRPPADIARYTMVFHKRDSGNEVNKDRSVDNRHLEIRRELGVCLQCDEEVVSFQDEVVRTNLTGLEEGRTEQLLIQDAVDREAASVRQCDCGHR